MSSPVLYSFRRCPYAMRARLALDHAGVRCELREISLKDKPAEFIAASGKATVPVMVLADGTVLEESLDIMLWALGENDPEAWLVPETGSREEMMALIAEADGPFKQHLDRFKYHTRYEAVDIEQEWAGAVGFLAGLAERLGKGAVFGYSDCLADFAIFPFVRQLANADRARFDGLAMPGLHAWLDRHTGSARFERIMVKRPVWQPGDEPVFAFG